MGRLLARITSLSIAVIVLSSGCSSEPAEDTPDPSEGPPAAAAAPATSAPPALPEPEPTPSKGPPCTRERCFSVTVSGDLLVHPQLWDQAAADAADTGKGPLDFEPLLAAQRPYLENSDLAVCHLETPVATSNGPFSGYPQFNVPPQIVTAAAEVGYEACTTASNHTIDAGTEGLLRTLNTLDAAGLDHTGSYATEADSQGLMILETPAARVAVIEATYGLNGLVADQPWRVDMLDIPTMVAKAEAARAQGADVVIAALHAGDEYASMPNEQQVQTAHALADSGAVDFIYGHHTHSILPIEKYADTWIVYGLGNGVTELSPTYNVNNEGLMVRAQFAEDDAGIWSVSDLAWVPSMIVRDPYRWCSLAPDQPAGSCTAAELENAARERTRSVVDALGAAEEGAHQWDLTAEMPAP